MASLQSGINTSLSADDSAVLLTAMLRRHVPFFYARFGDGFIECVNRQHGQTCDGERYSPKLAAELMECWRALMAAAPGTVHLGDWMTASFNSETERTRYAKEYAVLVGAGGPRWLHFEALLLMRESQALVNFYRAVRGNDRRKVYMGPAECAGAARMMDAEHLVTPMENLLEHVPALTDRLLSMDFEVLLYGAGMAGNIPVVKCWQAHPERTYVNIGSSVDILFRGRSRMQQIAPERARWLFRELL